MSFTTIRHSGVPENTHSAVWRTGEKPYDPLDPGPFGAPGWRPDPRRGRRRRGELPDPQPVDRTSAIPEVRRGALPVERPGAQPEPGRARPPRPAPTPVPAAPSEPAGQHAFSPMREAAYRDFLRDSEELHRAHLEPPEPNRVLVYLRWYLQIVVAVLYWRVLPFPEPPSRCRRSRAACEVRQGGPAQGRASIAPGPGRLRPVVPGPIEPRPIAVEWRTADLSGPRRARDRRSDPPLTRSLSRPFTRPHTRPHPVMSPRDRARSRRRADTRRVFIARYGMTRDKNFRNLNWPRGGWQGMTLLDMHPANPRRGAVKRRHNRRPSGLALARSFPRPLPRAPRRRQVREPIAPKPIRRSEGQEPVQHPAVPQQIRRPEGPERTRVPAAPSRETSRSVSAAPRTLVIPLGPLAGGAA